MGKILLGVAGGILIVIAALVALVTFYSGPELSVQISSPGSVAVDESFSIVLHISNPHGEPVMLDSIDIDNAVFESFEITSVIPEPVDPEPMTIIGQQSYTFQRVLGPAAAEDVEFRFRANSAGTYQIPLDVCNAYQDCSRTPVPISVTTD